MEYQKPTHKISVLKAKTYKLPNKTRKLNELSFNSKIKVTRSKNNFLKFAKGWVYKDQVKQIKYIEKNPFKRINIFR